MEVKPTYVTFEQAKELKEKGFNVPCIGNYDGYIDSSPTEGTTYNKYESLDWNSIKDIRNTIISRPEQWQVIEWLRIKHHIWISAIPLPYSENLTHWRWNYKCADYNNRSCVWEDKTDYLSPQEATSAAIDYVLKELL